MPRSVWFQTLGCPKNEVDSEKLLGGLHADGYVDAQAIEAADLIVVNTCAFIEDARRESIETILAATAVSKPEAKVVVTGCMAQRYPDELRAELPEVALIAPFGVPVDLPMRRPAPYGEEPKTFDLLELPRSKPDLPWAYVKIAEGCDRSCGFCAIPSFRGPQRSRTQRAILDEIIALDVSEVVFVAQDLASYGRDVGEAGSIVRLVRDASRLVERLRLLYLFPSDLSDELVDAILDTGVSYFDLSLQHASKPLLRAMRRWGDGTRFLERIDYIRNLEPNATFRSNFIVGYPGETEADHDQLLEFVQAAQLDWVGFFPFSLEEGTHAAKAAKELMVPQSLASQRLAELSELQDSISRARRLRHVGDSLSVLVERVGLGRSVHEAPEIDGVVFVPQDLPIGSTQTVEVVDCDGLDLVAAGATSFDFEEDEL